MSEKPKYRIIWVDELPPRKLLRAREKTYDEILEEIVKEKRKKIAKIELPEKSPKTVYSAMVKRLREKPFKGMLKLHVRNNELYIEKIE